MRAQNIVGSWTRTLTNTSLNELRVGYNRMHARRFPPTNNVPSMQELGVRLPIYPDQPSISEINASGYFNIGDNLEASFVRNGLELNDRFTLVQGEAQHPGRRRSAELHGRDSTTSSGARDTSSSTAAAPATRSPTSCLATCRPSTRAPASTRTTTSGTDRSSFRTISKSSPRFTLNLGLRYENTPPWHEIERPHRVFLAREFQQQRALDRVPAGAEGRDSSAATLASRTTAPTRKSNNFGPRAGFAWDLTGDGKTSLRGGGGMFYDQHRDGESGNGAVNAAPWSIRLCVTRPAGPFSDPYRGRTDFNLINDDNDRDRQGPVPDAGAD